MNSRRDRLCMIMDRSSVRIAVDGVAFPPLVFEYFPNTSGH